MESVFIIAAIIVAVALFFDFTNGFNDSANQVATIIFSRALDPFAALFIAATANFIGAYLLGTAVAQTIGAGIVDPRVFHEGGSGIIVIFSALVGAILWNLITWYFGIPSSSSHALIGGLVGAFLFSWGPAVINWQKILDNSGDYDRIADCRIFRYLYFYPPYFDFFPMVIAENK